MNVTHGLFAIYDLKAEAYNPPFTVATKGQAIRAFSDLVNDSNSSISKHPEDYVLFKLGTIDISTGALNQELERIAHATDFVTLPSNAVPLSVKR